MAELSFPENTFFYFNSKCRYFHVIILQRVINAKI